MAQSNKCISYSSCNLFACLLALQPLVVESIKGLKMDVSHMKLVDIKNVLNLRRTQIVWLKLVVTVKSRCFNAFNGCQMQKIHRDVTSQLLLLLPPFFWIDRLNSKSYKRKDHRSCRYLFLLHSYGHVKMCLYLEHVC